ncbi:cytochrome b562 family protein [Vibrio sp. JPW-9-11-11]|uniref:cytochrome b562 n=1 Tax=Vibrio sp. JPW-9-11-11 TaxID=1416532 RepID=UPI00159312CD|nr:cytochrome b562 [Vibrio sp. JPW-9-11-11]NVD07796.1 cytochrome b562 family protein [Vibrio sp. JPW-9-11-11]
MRKLLPIVALVLSAHVYAEDVDLKATMKQMKVEFKQAAQAEQIEPMQAAIANLTSLVAQSKQGDYPPEKTELYLEGFNKLSMALAEVDAKLSAGDLAAAKQALREVDALREEYHDKRNPSIWSKIFG